MSVIWTALVKAGQSWTYNQQGITYDALFDDVTHLAIFYEAMGTTPTFNNQTKS